jgi:hypothetical protein
MKLKFFSGILLILILINSCKDKNKLVSFNLDTSDAVYIIPLGDSLLTDTITGNEGISLQTEDFKFSSYDKFKMNQTVVANIEDVEAYNIRIAIDSGATNLSFMKDLKIYIGSGTGQDKEVASFDFPSDTLSAEMRLTNDEWLNLMRKDKYYFRTDFIQIAPVPDSVALKFRMNFRLKAMPND